MAKFREIKINQTAISQVTKALQKGELVSGPFVTKVEEKMCQVSGNKYAVAVNSGTMALKIALQCLGVRPGDNVLIPDLTFISCASSIIELGAIPVFADVDKDTFVLTKETVAKAIKRNPKRKIKLILAVHLGGAEVTGLESFGLPVLYDSAHLVAKAPNKTSCFSFYPSKIIAGIDGGCITTNDKNLYRQARRLRNFGFFEGTRKVVEAGYKGAMTNISAIVIYNHLLNLNTILKRRTHLRDLLNTQLGLTNTGLGMYFVKVGDPSKITGVNFIQHYLQTLSKIVTGRNQNPSAAYLARHVISLPFHEFMTDKEAISLAKKIKPHLSHD